MAHHVRQRACRRLRTARPRQRPPAGSTLTVDPYTGSPATCSGPEQTFTVTGLPAGLTVPVPNLHAFPAATVGSSVPIWVTNTANGPTWITLCQAGHPIASAWKHPGQGMPHDVSGASPGTSTYVAMQSRASCTTAEESRVSIGWTGAS